MPEDQNKKSLPFKATFIAALSGALTFVGGYFLNTRLPHNANSVGIGNATNINDLPSFRCDLVTLGFAKGDFVCGAPGAGPMLFCNTNSWANNAFWNNFPNYDESRLSAVCKILRQFCSTENYKKLYHFVAENVAKNSHGTQDFSGNCDTTTFFGEMFMGLGVVIIVAALIALLFIAGSYCHDKKKNQRGLQTSLIENHLGSSHLFGATHSDQPVNTSSSLVNAMA